MKRIVFLTCIGSLALTLTALGAPNKAKKGAPAVSAKGGGHAMSHVAPARTSRGYSAARVRTTPTSVSHARSNVAVQRERSRMRMTPTATSSARIHARDNLAVQRERNINRASTLRNSRVEAARAANANARFSPRGNVSRGGNINGTTNQVAVPQTRSRIVNNWQNVGGQNYAAFRDYRRQWHDRSWWQNNYSRIILVGGGWWYWNSGYWYPAWGYDPYYTYYPYDGPIYGYGDLTPDRIVVRVQSQLRNDGYYVGAVDGVLGPQTRHAIAAFQADHGLAVTSAVDEPTLATLGLS